MSELVTQPPNQRESGRIPFESRNELVERLKGTPLCRTVVGRIDHHIKIAEENIRKYGKWSLRVRWWLPILSTIATGSATVAVGAQTVASNSAPHHEGFAWLAGGVAFASFLSTGVSSLNHAMRPTVQFAHYVRYINKFWHLQVQLECDLEDVILRAKDESHAELLFHDRLMELNRQVEEVIETFSDASITNIGVPPSDSSAGHKPAEIAA